MSLGEPIKRHVNIGVLKKYGTLTSNVERKGVGVERYNILMASET